MTFNLNDADLESDKSISGAEDEIDIDELEMDEDIDIDDMEDLELATKLIMA